MSLLNNILHTISDHGNAVASKVVTYYGLASIGTGGALGVTSGTVDKVVQSQGLGLADYAAIVSIIGGVCLIIKNLVDVYFTIQEKRNAKNKK